MAPADKRAAKAPRIPADEAPPAPEEIPSPSREDSTPPPRSLEFIRVLNRCGLLSELTAVDLDRYWEGLATEHPVVRQLSFLERYYQGDGDSTTASRRTRADRFFLHHDESRVNAHDLVARLFALCPELPELKLERIGTDEGPLVLRCGEHVSAVVDELEEEMDTDEIDLRQLDDHGESISVNALVRSLNVLLERHEARHRMVELVSDGEREAYVGVLVAGAMTLCQMGLLEHDDAEFIMEFGAW